MWRFCKSYVLVVSIILFATTTNLKYKIFHNDNNEGSSSFMFVVNGFVPTTTKSFPISTGRTVPSEKSSKASICFATTSTTTTGGTSMRAAATTMNTGRPQQQRQQRRQSRPTTRNGNSNLNSTATARPGQRQQQRPNSSQQQRRQQRPPRTNSITPTNIDTFPQPWRAHRIVSQRTQKRIQDTAKKNHNSPIEKCIDVLNTLHRTKPEECNQANVNCALTLTAKLLTNGRQSFGRNRARPTNRDKEQLRSLLMQTFDVLHFLVADNRLNERQLCNAVWAIGKHYNRDKTILPTYKKQTSSVSLPVEQGGNTAAVFGGTQSVSELWMFDTDEHNDSSEKRLDETIDLIANQLTTILKSQYGKSSTDDDNGGNKQKRKKQNTSNFIKIGEIAMATWAYGILKPRRLPPGWKSPRQMGRLPSEPQTTPPLSSRQVQLMQRQQQDEQRSLGVEFVTLEDYEGWNENEDDNNNMNCYEYSTNGIDKLFDAIGTALTRPIITEEEEEDDENDDSSSVVITGRTLIQTASWKEISNIAWSYATHGHCRTKPSEGVMMILTREAIRRLINNQSSKSLAPVDGAATNNNSNNNQQQFLTRDVAQLVWSMGTLHSDNYRLGDDLVDLIGAVANYWLNNDDDNDDGRPLKHWSCADLVQVIVSMSHGRVDHLPLLTAIYDEAYKRIEEDTYTDQYGNIRKSTLLTRGNKRNGGGNNDDRRKTFFTWEISVLLWAQARMTLNKDQNNVFDDFVNIAPVRLIEAMEASSDSNTLEGIGIGQQEQANIAWSLTVLEKYDTTIESKQLLRSIFIESAKAVQSSRIIQLEHAHQLWQSLFLLEDECPDIFTVNNNPSEENDNGVQQTASSIVPQWFYDFLKDKWLIEKSRRKISSARHKAISQTLNFMGVSHYNEHDEDIDVAIVLKEGISDILWTGTQASSSSIDAKDDQAKSPLKVAVEFDGPNHFTRENSYSYAADQDNEDDNNKDNNKEDDTSRNIRDKNGKVRPRALGHTVLKYRLLKKQGWTVVRVPYYEFDKIPFWASMERQRYLQRLLKTHAELSFSTVDVSEYKAPVPNRQTRFD